MKSEQEFNELSGRLPPQNIEAEEAILGGILLDPEAMGRIVDVLRPEMFYVVAHQEIFRACLMLHNQARPTDMMSVSTWLSDRELLEKVGGQNKIVTLCDRTLSAVNIDYYAELVQEKYIRRQLADAGRATVSLSFSGDTELAHVLDQAEQKIFAVTQAKTQQGLIPAADILTQTFYELEKRSNLIAEGGDLPGLTTGFYDFDNMTNGLQRSDLIIIAGRPSMGKTAFGLEISRKIAEIHYLPIAIFSLEMSRDQLIYRLLSSQSKMRPTDLGIDSNRLRSGQISEHEWGTVTNAISRLSDLPIYIDDTPSPSLTELRSKVRRLQAEKGTELGLVIIDYLQLMEGSGSDNRVQELSRITRSLKSLAREMKVPVIALSQLSRGVEARTNKRPMLSDLRESGCITGDALITMADTGIQTPIRDLVGTEFAIWALNEKMQLQRAIATKAFSTGIKPIWELQTQSGRKIKATANHQFLTIHGWKRLDELSINDRLAVPRKNPILNLEQSMENAEIALLGHLIGDGCTLPRHCIQYTTKEIDLAQTVSDLAITVFGDKIIPKINRELHWYQVYLSAGFKLTHSVSNPITKWLKSLEVFGLRSYEKFVPDVIFSQPQSAISLFLRHLWSTDGCIFIGKNYPSIYYASSSQKLAINVQSLLLKLEINATLRNISQNGKGRIQYNVQVSGKQDILRFINLVGAVGNYKQNTLGKIADYINAKVANTNCDVIPNDFWRIYAVPAMKDTGLTNREFQSQLGNHYCGTSLYKTNVSRERALKIATITRSAEIERLANSDIYWDKVISIFPCGESDVYDLTVPVFHNFVANNIIVHNSIEQDADLVINLYRDEYYNPDTPDKGIAEIIIAKHRNGPTGTVKLLFDARLTKFENISSR